MAMSYADVAGFSSASYETDPLDLAEISYQEDPRFYDNFNDDCDCRSEDFVVFAEFSELTGPVPLFTIPSYIIQNEDIDINNLIMKIMSVEYQVNSCENHFSFLEDVQTLMTNIVPGRHVYAHYVTLNDLKARGFVRPLCIAYLSADELKMQNLFETFREEFLNLTSLMKTNNREWFMDQILQALHNLKEEQNQYFDLKKKEEDGLTLLPEELSKLEKIKLDELVQLCSDYKDILHKIESVLDTSKLEVLRSWESNFRNCTNPEIDSYVKYISDSKKVDTSLKGVGVISPWGIAAAVWQLLNVVRKNSICRIKIPVTDMFRKIVTDDSKVVDPINEAKQDQEYHELLTLLTQSSSSIKEMTSSQQKLREKSNVPILVPEQENYEHLLSESVKEVLNIVDSADVASILSDKVESKSVSTADNFSVHSFENISVEEGSWCGSDAHHVEDWGCVWSSSNPISLPGCLLLKFFKTFEKEAQHVIYSLLIGRTIVLAGSEKSERKVQRIMNALRPLIPAVTEDDIKFLRWHKGIIVESFITTNHIIGVCVPERLSILDMISSKDKNTTTILNVDDKQLFGPAYSGTLLTPLENCGDRFSTDYNLLLFMKSVAVDLEMKVFVWENCLNRKDIQLSGCDIEIVKHLSSLKLWS